MQRQPEALASKHSVKYAWPTGMTTTAVENRYSVICRPYLKAAVAHSRVGSVY